MKIRLQAAAFAAVAVAVTLVLAACGSSETATPETGAVDLASSSSDIDNGPAATAEPETDPVPSPEPEPTTQPEPSTLKLPEANWEGLTERSLAAMGGLRLGVPAGHVVHHDGDMVVVRPEFSNDKGAFEPSMIIARANTSAQGELLSTTSFTTSAIAGVGVAEETNISLSLLGEELDGWRFSLQDGQPDGPHYIYSSYPAGAGGATAWQPFPLAELFIGEVPGGVLVAGWIGRDESALAEARAIFDAVAPTLSLEQPLSESAEAVPPLMLAAPQQPPEPVDVPDGWPPVLSGLSRPLDAGDYSHGGFGTAFSFTIDDGWWVQPNFPSWLVLSADDSFGPGDRGIVVRSGVDSLHPAIRAGGAGDPISYDLQAFIETPPPNLEIVESEEVTVGGAAGLRAHIAFAESADCAAGAVCEYMVATSYTFPPASIRAGYHYEFWQLEEGLAAPITIILESPDASWFEVARSAIDSIVFDIDG